MSESFEKFTDNSQDELRMVCVHLYKVLKSASHALRSFQYGNSSEEFAKDIADICDEELIKAQEVLNK